MAGAHSTPRLLCVDDEPSVVAGIAANLRKEVQVVTATSGALGLEAIDRGPAFAVVISDMHMPQMNGVAFLSEVRRRAPDTVRLLLTGNADLETAILAVNEGQLFRFLRKPASVPELKSVVLAAVEQHNLVTAERVLLEQTLRGTVETLMDMLAVVNPAAFGHAAELRKLVSSVGAAVGLTNLWRLEVAAMFSQLSAIAVSPELLEKALRGAPLDEAEKAGFARGAKLVDGLLAKIPRLEPVRAILLEEQQLRGREGIAIHGNESLAAAQVLRVCARFARVTGQGITEALVIERLRSRAEGHEARIIDALARVRGVVQRRDSMRELPARDLAPGMVLAEDLHASSGGLIARKGYEVTEGFVERVRGQGRGYVREPVRILADASDEPRGG